jgi:hypothetical protein
VESRAAASNWKTAGSDSASSPLPFLAGGDNHRHLQKKKKRKQSFGSSSPFLDLLSFCFLSSSRSVFFCLLSSSGGRSGGCVSVLELR